MSNSTTLPITSFTSNLPPTSSNVQTTPSSSILIPSSSLLTPSPSSTPPASSAPASSPPISPTVLTSTVIQSPPPGSTGQPSTVVKTVTTTPTPAAGNSVSSSALASSSAAASGSTVTTGDSTSGQSNSNAGTIAAAVVVPVVVVALLVLAGIWFWRKRKQRKEAEELRKKEMEEYSYNPNNDPTIPAVGALSNNGDESERGDGYRGWGTTSAATRKASTTLSGSNGGIGIARSDSGGHGYNGQYSPNGPNSEVHSGDPLMDRTSANSETIGALGAAPVSNNRGGGVNRGPSNASSAYSGGANRSDGSGEGPPNGPVGSPQYYNELMYQDDGMPHNHVDGSWSGQPVIRDVSARRNTRIENPSVIPQQGNAGISQNF